MKNFKPIAMRCDEAQFESIKDQLIELGCVIVDIGNHWDKLCYLVNNYNGVIFHISNTVADTNDTYGRTNYETFDPEIFLAACGKERKIIGYKRNPNMDVTAKQLSALLKCSSEEKDGLFYWHISPALDRAKSLNIIGEDKLLIPVYEEITTPSLDEFLKMDREQQLKYKITL